MKSIKKSLPNIICLIILLSIVFLIINICIQKNIKDILQAETNGKYAENEIEGIVSETVDPVTEVTITLGNNVIIRKGDSTSIVKKLTGGQEYKSIEYTSSNENILTIDSNTERVTGVGAGTATITCTITNYDETSVTGSCTLTVVDLEYNPNGGEYVASYNNNISIPAKTATIETEIIMEGIDSNVGEVQYAWNQNAQTQPTSWTIFSKIGGTISKTDAAEGSWYLWIKISHITGSEKYVVYRSNAFVVKEDIIYSTSTEYKIEEGYIREIQPNTKISDFKTKIVTNVNAKIYDNEENELDDDDIVKTGIKIVLEEGTSYKIVVKGDVDGDGKVDIEDIFAINKHRLNKLKLENEFLLAGDVNDDKEADFNDILQINKYRLEKIQIL